MPPLRGEAGTLSSAARLISLNLASKPGLARHAPIFSSKRCISEGACPDFELRSMDKPMTSQGDPTKSNVYSPGPQDRTVRNSGGMVQSVPDSWSFLIPGDAALTRRVKQAGDHWIVQEIHRNKVFTRGLWAPTETIERIQRDLESERSTESYAKRRAASTRRRENQQAEYVEDFLGAVVAFLRFHPLHSDLATKLAKAVTEHATPVGSGTVARTKTIPVEQRAEAAVIAWMRHQTTAYDSMKIPRVKGERREVRRMLAQRSRELLEAYRAGKPASSNCPLRQALADTQ